MLRLVIMMILALCNAGQEKNFADYEAWTDTGIHLMVCDNGTPDDYEDDWIYDWETNREFTITIHD